MVSTGIKSSEFSIRHSAKPFYFNYFFITKPNKKIWRHCKQEQAFIRFTNKNFASNDILFLLYFLHFIHQSS